MSFKNNLKKAKGGKPEDQPEGKGFPVKGGFKKAAANAKKKCGKKGC